MDDRTYDLMVQQAKKYGDALSELSFAKSRIEALEKALREIVDTPYIGKQGKYHTHWYIARAALGEKKDG